jgi:hypothetical protein
MARIYDSGQNAQGRIYSWDLSTPYDPTTAIYN